MKEVIIVFVVLAFATVGLLNRSSVKIIEAGKIDSLVEEKLQEQKLIMDTVKSNVHKIEQLNNSIK